MRSCQTVKRGTRECVSCSRSTKRIWYCMTLSRTFQSMELIMIIAENTFGTFAQVSAARIAARRHNLENGTAFR